MPSAKMVTLQEWRSERQSSQSQSYQGPSSLPSSSLRRVLRAVLDRLVLTGSAEPTPRSPAGCPSSHESRRLQRWRFEGPRRHRRESPLPESRPSRSPSRRREPCRRLSQPWATICASICPWCPTVRVCPPTVIVPSTRPSIVKSSEADRSPLTTIDFPRSNMVVFLVPPDGPGSGRDGVSTVGVATAR